MPWGSPRPPECVLPAGSASSSRRCTGSCRLCRRPRSRRARLRARSRVRLRAVVQAVSVGRVRANGPRARDAVRTPGELTAPHDGRHVTARTRVVPPGVVGGGQAAAGRVLPLALVRQPQPGPGAVGERVVDGDGAGAERLPPRRARHPRPPLRGVVQVHRSSRWCEDGRAVEVALGAGEVARRVDERRELGDRRRRAGDRERADDDLAGRPLLRVVTVRPQQRRATRHVDELRSHHSNRAPISRSRSSISAGESGAGSPGV